MGAGSVGSPWADTLGLGRMWRAWLRCAGHAAVIVVLVTIGLSPGAARAAGPGPGFFGVNDSTVWQLAPQDRDRHLAQIAAAGIRVVRVDTGLNWPTVEPRPPQNGVHTYDWAATDTELAALAAHGLAVYPILDYSPPWAAATPDGNPYWNPFSRPADPAWYAAYAGAFAARYGRNGTFWSAHPELSPHPVTTYEIWNEENFPGFWQEQSTAPDDYGDLYLAAHDAIHAVDPNARVVVGGLASGYPSEATTFLTRMIGHLGSRARLIDAVGLHPYESTVPGMIGAVKAVRAILAAAHLKRVPIEITEVGFNVKRVPEPVRAAWYRRLACGIPYAGLGVSRLIPYTWNEKPDGGWSIANADGTPAPSGQAYADAATGHCAGVRGIHSAMLAPELGASHEVASPARKRP